MAENIVRVEVTPRLGETMRDVRGDLVKRRLIADHNIEFEQVRSIVGYLVNSDIGSQEVANRIDDLFVDPIIEVGITDELQLNNSELFSSKPDMVVSVGFKPGVTDNPGKAALDGFLTIFPEAGGDAKISTYLTFAFWGVPDGVEIEWLSKQLHNCLLYTSPSPRDRG